MADNRYRSPKSHIGRSLIKSVLRSTMSQERLSDLSILCIENDKLRLIDFDDNIDEFTAIGKLEGRCFDNNYLPTVTRYSLTINM